MQKKDRQATGCSGHTKRIIRKSLLKASDQQYKIIFLKLAFSLLGLFASSGHAFAQQKLAPGEHFANVNGITLHYYVSGKGPVCLVPSPGWGAFVDYLRTLTPFEKHFTMVYYDTRKSGQSTGPDDPKQYTDQDLANDMDSLRVFLGQSKVWLTGHSGGGYQVLNYGTQHGENVYGIIALDAIALYDSLQEAEALRTIRRKKNAPAFDEAKAAYFNIDSVKNRTRTIEEFVNVIFPLYVNDPDILKELPGIKVSAAAFRYTHASNIYRSKNLLEDLYKITVPVLVVVGEDDFICGPESQAKRIHQRIASSELVIIKNSGHFPWIEQPAQFYAAFEKWVEKQRL